MERGLIGRLADMARASPGELGLIALLSLTIVGGSVLVLFRTSDPPPPPIQRSVAASPSPRPEKKIFVHVAGMVAAPGVYDLAEGSRVQDAIEAAGGPKDGADLDVLNLAALLSDGQKIMVARPGDPGIIAPDQGSNGPAGGAGEAGAGGSAGSKLSLNTATQAQLEELPSIGPVIAERILGYRQQKGRFTSVKQLQDIEGIGPKKYEGVKDLVVV